MIRTYVLRNFRRRKVRTALMALALVVGVGTLVALNATVDSYRRYYAGTVAGEVGAFDLVVTRKDTEPNPFLDADTLVRRVRAVPGVAAAAPRVHAVASLQSGTQTGDTALVALDPAADRFGALEITAGELALGEGPDGLPGAVVLQETADVFGLEVGDPVVIRYAAPRTRLAGRAEDDSASQARTTATWIVRGIGTQRGLSGQADNQGVVVGLAAARERFGLGRTAERLVVGFDPKLFESSDPQRSAFAAREVAFRVKDALDDEGLAYLMPRPRAVTDGANAFIFFQSLITMYGLLSLGVVGMLIRTLIMTNVQEQTRDMAVLRILGAPRRYLFDLVAGEVAAIGLVGIGLGVVVGQAVNNLAIVPFLAGQAGGLGAETPLVSVEAVAIAVVVAVATLSASALTPARKAAGTKITHAINPGIADGLGLDDLAKLRERRTDLRVSGAGLVILVYPALIFFAFPLAFDFGVLWVMAALIFGALLALIVGAALLFFVVILPMERALVRLIEAVRPRVGYFVRRTVLRAKARNTLISLMIVVSATLPTFLSTTFALEVANSATDRRMNGGAAFRLSPPSPLDGVRGRRGADPSALREAGFAPELLAAVRADPGFAATAAITGPYPTAARDGVGLREVTVQAVGVDGDLGPVLYPEAADIVAGRADALARIAREPGTAIIGAGLATYFDRGPGDTLVLQGEGRDHLERLTIVGVASRVGGVGVFSAKQTRVWSGESTVLVGARTYEALAIDPRVGPSPGARPFRRLLASPAPGVDEGELTSDLRLRYATEHDLTVDSTAETIETVQEESRTGQLFLLVLTALTSVLAVFGVFAVIYVSIYGRRGEIGMLKAVGSPGRHLLWVFVGEAMVMTLSATFTGVTAGVLLAFALRISEGFQNEVPTTLAFDRVVVPLMLLLMLVSSLASAVIATHSYRRKSAIEILRTV